MSSHRHQRTRTFRRAFSLIELLVVISIIAILASILLPTVTMIRSAAIKSKCASQMRQLGLAMAAYAGDHDGLLSPSWVGAEAAPPEWGFASVGSPAIWWTGALLGQYLDGFDQVVIEELPRSKWKSVVKCPATKRTDDRDWEGTMSMNATYCPRFGGTDWWDVALSRVPKQSQMVAIIDGSRPFWYPGGPTYSTGMNGGWWPWHGGSSANMLYFDGHTAFTSNASAEFITGRSFGE